ncbi:MAG: HD domain-containing protein [Candidatus Omnitrophota bacterium]|nr:MAG: HD domain-containing protein [Candidatus Omnitrophota bacterium]
MKKIHSLLQSFQARITIVLILAMLFMGALSNFLIYRFTLGSQLESLRTQLKMVAQTAALTIDPGLLSRVPLKKEGINSPQFKTIAAIMAKIQELNPTIEDIYTMSKTSKPGIWKFVVDPNYPSDDEIAQGSPSAYPGDEYDASRFSEMLKAFQGPAADTKLEVDEWGTTLSGYAPIRNKKGEAIAMIGIDVAADNVHKMQQGVHSRALLVFILGIVVSLGLGVLLSKGIATPLNKLVEGTRHIAKGDLQYQVKLGGSREIKELAESFNFMAQALSEAKKKLHSYFYRVVQSLVQILEAKDPYTRGHSERVAAYTEKIASRMGIPKEKVDLLKESAVLHDIGKLGIGEEILNKKERLTDAEWDLLRKHPELGVKLLRPVLLSQDMEAAIKGHHERYDGKGYPDHLDGKHIHLFAQIVAVADAYDAMTSSRAYRKALSKKEAIEELKKNSGVQFEAHVVDAFLRILEEES